MACSGNEAVRPWSSRSQDIGPSTPSTTATSATPYTPPIHSPSTTYSQSAYSPSQSFRNGAGQCFGEHSGPLPPLAGMPHSLQQRRSPFINSHAMPQSPHYASPVAMLYPAIVLGTVQDPLRLGVRDYGSSSSVHNGNWRTFPDNSDTPAPLPSYTLDQCIGLFKGPTLYAFHAFTLSRRFPFKRDSKGESYLQKAHQYLFAERPPLETNQLIIGIDSEHLSHLAIAAVITNNIGKFLMRFCHEVCRISREVEMDDNATMSFTDIRTGYHGALSMLRLMRQAIFGAEAASDPLATLLAQAVVTQHFGYFKDWAEGVKIGDHGPRMEILWRLTTVEDDIGLLTEMALLWPDASSAAPGTNKNNLADAINYELWVILAYQQDDGNWPTVVGKSHIAMRTAALLERGRWYVIACLQHLHAYFASALPSRRYMIPLIEKALLRLESPAP